MIQKQIDAISKSDIDELIANSVNESKTLEHKQELPGNSDKDKKEFLADVSSFANASGGDILYGVAATDGIATSACGLTGFSEDAERLRLESMIRDGIAPRLPGLQLKVLTGFADGPVLVMRVPKSWSGPHMVTYKGGSRFFARNSADKFQLDVAEIRSAFEGSGDVASRITNWRDDRLSRIVSDEGPIRLVSPERLVVHLVPLESLNDPWRFAANELDTKGLAFHPMDTSGWDHRLNLDGYLAFSGADATNDIAMSYTQVFRSGQVESVMGHILTEENETRFLASVWYEQEIVKAVHSHFKGLESIGVQPPIVFMLTIMNAKGAFLSVDSRRRFGRPTPIDRDVLIVPDVLFERFDNDIPQTLRPAFDAVWNACGFPRSANFDDDGNWSPRR